jgi:hypothetical protein
MPSDGQVQACDAEPKPGDGQVVICDPLPKPGDGKIVICAGEEDPCELATLTITLSADICAGDSNCCVGSQFLAAGGTPPYTWSFSRGTISATGEVTAIDACVAGQSRWGLVSVEDACGNVGELTVRLAGGKWVTVESYTDSTPGNVYSVDSEEAAAVFALPAGQTSASVSGSIIIDGYKYAETIRMFIILQRYTAPCYGPNPWSPTPDNRYEGNIPAWHNWPSCWTSQPAYGYPQASEELCSPCGNTRPGSLGYYPVNFRKWRYKLDKYEWKC